jgi:hypothetical protein
VAVDVPVDRGEVAIQALGHVDVGHLGDRLAILDGVVLAVLLPASVAVGAVRLDAGHVGAVPPDGTFGEVGGADRDMALERLVADGGLIEQRLRVLRDDVVLVADSGTPPPRGAGSPQRGQGRRAAATSGAPLQRPRAVAHNGRSPS